MTRDNLVFAVELVGLLLGWAAIAGALHYRLSRRRWHHRSYCAGMKAAAAIFGSVGVLRRGEWHRPHLN